MHTAMSVMHAYSGLNEPANHTEGCPQARAEQASPRPQKQKRLAGHCCSSLAPKSNPQNKPPKGGKPAARPQPPPQKAVRAACYPKSQPF